MSAWFPRITLHSLAILVSVLTYVLTTRVERERRPPSIAIAWVLGMIALPYVVLPAYLLFGRRKLPRKTLTKNMSVTPAKHWAQDLIESFGLAGASGCAINMHGTGDESATALYATMDIAAYQLDICTYILGDDTFGRDAMQRMMERARRGVQVRLLLDGVGALQLPRQHVKDLRTAGVQVAVFSPLLARKTQGPRNLRNHRKMTIADGARLWAGGRNIAAEYFTGIEGAAPWGDLTFDLHGPVANAAATQFEEDWVAAGGKPASQNPIPAAAADFAAPSTEAATSLAQFLPSGPDQTEDTVHALLIDACFQARHRMLAVTPYFVPDASFESALRLAARRGIDINLCIPAKSNHVLADFARNRALRALSAAGVHVHLLPFMNHAKAVVFDDSIAFAGSVNLDSRSLLLNYECAVVFYGAAEVRWLASWIENLIPQARPFDPRQPTLLRDLIEGLLLTVAYQL